MVLIEGRRRIGVVVLEGRPVVIEGIRACLERDEAISVLGLAADIPDMLDLLARQRPDVLVLCGHQTGPSIAKAASCAKALLPALRILAIADGYRGLTLDESGVLGHLDWTVTGPEMVLAVRLVSMRRKVLGVGQSAETIDHAEHFTRVELRVLQLLLQGKRNGEIARELDRTEKTIEYHITHILAKLGVRSRAEAIAKARDIGLSIS